MAGPIGAKRRSRPNGTGLEPATSGVTDQKTRERLRKIAELAIGFGVAYWLPRGGLGWAPARRGHAGGTLLTEVVAMR